MENEANEILEFTEFETKYKIQDGEKLFDFKDLASKLDPKSFLYVQGYDRYYIKSEEEFIRYRKAEHDKSGRAELTIKSKKKDANNINRLEVNLRVDKNDLDTVEAFTNTLGFNFNFAIWKACHIYHYDDATLVFYTVRDENKTRTHFLEIEVREDMDFTEEQAWDIIKKYENLLTPLGISPQRRLKKSLYEMYRKV